MMKNKRQPASWPVVAGVAAVAALMGFGVARVLLPGNGPVPAKAADAQAASEAAAAKPAGPREVRIPTQYLAAANIAVEPVASVGVGSEILAPA
ncbi:Na+/H+-dicarboxylate symporter [Cupriavidus metallidurans]|jgi:cobalt-zinc-cadmium efflux system membrane fusion protein|uniref:hypothetical protein n=1 Tax=Cupriavidus TaxID=106589 RepID=UPI000054F491|nr:MULTISPECIES: hypothetical protein [Cupriavidus]KWW35655.1 Nickel and cobalt resistance protein CnrB [Cupriavidus metallidurans]MDE4921796.1 hypothetical protein [Cupriavidus metallidurans]